MSNPKTKTKQGTRSGCSVPTDIDVKQLRTEYGELKEFIRNDKEASAMKQRLDFIESELERLRPEVWKQCNAKDGEMHAVFSDLTDEEKELKKKYEDYIRKSFPYLNTMANGVILTKVLEGASHMVINHCLKTFEQLVDGKIDAETGANVGMDFSVSHYKLPHDFFDQIRQTNKKKKKH